MPRLRGLSLHARRLLLDWPKVEPKYGYSLKIGDQVLEKQNLFHVYTVQRANGDWLWVASGSVEGWIWRARL